ncbi:hypothetical protein D3C81_1715030 [compost metagenome]
MLIPVPRDARSQHNHTRTGFARLFKAIGQFGDTGTGQVVIGRSVSQGDQGDAIMRPFEFHACGHGYSPSGSGNSVLDAFGEAAIDHQIGTAGVARRRAGEEDDGLGDFFRTAKTPRRLLAEDGVKQRFHVTFHQAPVAAVEIGRAG